MRRSNSALFRHLLLLLGLLNLLATPVLGSEADLIAAAQKGDIATVKKLLEDGVDVNARSRYGATALFFACDKTNVELVQLLLTHGADPEIEDTFYGATALGWAQGGLTESAEDRAIVLALVERVRPEGEDLDSLLLSAVEAEDSELVALLIEKKRVSLDALRAGADLAESKSYDKLAATLRELAPADETAEVLLTAKRWSEMAGRYTNDEFGNAAEIKQGEDGYTARLSDGKVRTLLPTSDHTFSVLGSTDVTISFEPATGPSSQFVWNTGNRQFTFVRATEKTETQPTEGVEAASPEPRVAAEPETPAVRTAAIHWPEFRGNQRSGNADGQGVPTTWDGEAGTNVVWKTPIPGLGLASPVIWGDRVFIATAVSESGDSSLKTGLYGDVSSVEDDSIQIWKLLAVDRTDGKLLWEQEAVREQPKVRRHLKSSHASPTPAADSERVVVSFGSAGLYCFDHSGQLLWKKDLGTLSAGWFYDPTYEWEFASSPILWQGNVLVQVDISGDSFVASYDGSTGEELWKTRRNEISSWGTPIVLPNPNGPDELVTNAPTIRGYDAATGAELWTLSPNSEVTVASPVLANDRIFVTGGYPPARPIYAIHPGGRGALDLAEGETASSVIPWSTERGGTYIPTPIVYQGQLYVLHNNGRLVAYDTTTGEEIYKARVGKNESYSASPIAADGKLFFSSEDGTTTVARAGTEYEVVATNELGEILMTTPAASDGVLVLRGHEHLFGISLPKEPKAATR